MEMSNHINTEQSKERSKDQTATRFQQVFLAFGVLCVIQACLNISLRLAYKFSLQEPAIWDCNLTQIGSRNLVAQLQCEESALVKCHRLQHKSDFLRAFCNLLNDKKALRSEIKELNDELKGLSNCGVLRRCPAGWKEINSKCYFVSSKAKSWEDSRADCQSRGGDLVVINDFKEQSDMYLLTGDSIPVLWIGLSGTKGTFKWVDGSSLTNTFWQRGQPDYGGPNTVEDCVEMYLLNPVAVSWNDAQCDRKQAWLCEKDPCPISFQKTPELFV